MGSPCIALSCYNNSVDVGVTRPCFRLLPVTQSRGCAMGSSMHRSLVSVLQHCVEVVCLPSKVGGGGVLGAAALWLGGGRGE